MPLKARLISHVGTRASLRVYWGDDCPNCNGGGNKGYHNAHVHLGDTEKLNDPKLHDLPEDHPDDRWPTKCEHCPAPVAKDANRQVFRRRLYNTPSGSPEPGDLYWTTWHGHTDVMTGEITKKCYWHDNCDGRHLSAVLPNGNEWDIDGRATNCTKPKDRTHRCWVRTGEPPNVTAGKKGDTCSAGAGSIGSGNYHGFLRNGEFT